MRKRTIVACFFAVVATWLGVTALAQNGPTADTSPEMGPEQAVAAAKKFLASLDEAQRGKVVFEFTDEAQRKRWSNLPIGAFQRAGLRMGDLTQPQRDAAMAVLEAALSPQGYEKIVQIVESDEVLKNQSGGRGPAFGRP